MILFRINFFDKAEFKITFSRVKKAKDRVTPLDGTLKTMAKNTAKEVKKDGKTTLS